MNKNSYTAASAWPIKVLQHEKLIKSIKTEGRILPIHIQLAPTNKCQLNCSFCSCSKRNKNLELNFDEMAEIICKAKALGCESCTVTGGGEPLLYPKFDDMINLIHHLKIEIGLVTNGINLRNQSSETLQKLTWCRISFSDYRLWDEDFFNGVRNAVNKSLKVDWAFSYVLTAKPDYDKLAKVIDFAKHYHFTHIRVVSDLLDLENVDEMDKVKKELQKRKVDDHLVIYQGRKDYTSGAKDCLISLLKPVVAPDGYLYPCCGSQYAEKKPARDFGSNRMRMGKATDIDKIYREQKFFDGSICKVCYYSNYNNILRILKEEVKHNKFV